MAQIDDKTTAALLSSLNNQRDHVLGVVEALPEEALRRPALPTGWTCLGLVHHLTMDVERFWFRRVMMDEPVDIPDNAWQVAPGVPANVVIQTYRQEVERANVIIAATPLDTAPNWWPDFFPNFRMDDLREIILHVITETACHAGHLDAARELINGQTWLILT